MLQLSGELPNLRSKMAPRVTFYSVPFIMLSTQGSLRCLTFTEFSEFINRTMIFYIPQTTHNNFISYDISKLSSVIQNNF